MTYKTSSCYAPWIPLQQLIVHNSPNVLPLNIRLYFFFFCIAPLLVCTRHTHWLPLFSFCLVMLLNIDLQEHQWDVERVSGWMNSIWRAWHHFLGFRLICLVNGRFGKGCFVCFITVNILSESLKEGKALSLSSELLAGTTAPRSALMPSHH